MRPLRLTTAQLNQLMRTAQPIPLGLREEYLVLVARSLSGRDSVMVTSIELVQLPARRRRRWRCAVTR